MKQSALPLSLFAATLGGLLLVSQARATDTCARLSTFDSAPRGAQLFPVTLIAINGELPGPVDAESFRLSPGTHVLKVAERIENNRFTSLENVARDGSRQTRYKEITLQAEAGMTYRLAARFFPDQRQDMRNGSYWGPEIWQTSTQSCS